MHAARVQVHLMISLSVYIHSHILWAYMYLFTRCLHA